MFLWTKNSIYITLIKCATVENKFCWPVEKKVDTTVLRKYQIKAIERVGVGKEGLQSALYFSCC